MSFLSEVSQEAKGVSLCAYLIGLAAFQKGLEVTYINNPKKARKVTREAGTRGTIIHISDGEKGYYFFRSRGELTSSKSHKLSRNKWQAKLEMQKHNVSVPKGLLVDRAEALSDESLFSKLECDSLVVKPLSGSLGRGVSVGVKSKPALEQALNSISSDKIIIEQEVFGEEYRYYVADNKVVAVTGREFANVIGNGNDSIIELVRKKNRERKDNPHLASRVIKLDRLALQHLRANGKDFDYIPKDGEKVYVSPSANLSRGGDSVDATNLVSELSKQTAVDAAKAIGIPNAGVDIINSLEGGKEKSYVIELNSQAHIGSHTFPMKGKGQGNNVAESIVNSYFPEHKNRLMEDVFFDFTYVKSALQDGGASGITMPVIQQSWVKRRIDIDLSNNEPKLLSNLRSLLIRSNSFGKVVKYDDRLCSIFYVGSMRTLGEITSNLERNRNIVHVEANKTRYPLTLKVEAVDFSNDKYLSGEGVYKRRLVIHGQVQGVGFRRWLKQVCVSNNIDGWVRNRGDGTVEALLSSPVKGHLMRVIDLCKDGSRKSVVTGMKIIISRRNAGAGFKIRKSV